MIDEIPHLDRAPAELTDLTRLWELGLLPEGLVIGEWCIHIDSNSGLGGIEPTHLPFLNVNLWVFGREPIRFTRLAFTAEYFPEELRPEIGRLVRAWRDRVDKQHRLLKWTRKNIRYLDHRNWPVPTWYLMNHNGNLEWSKGEPPPHPYGLSAQ